jgi:hypothetical protein
METPTAPVYEINRESYWEYDSNGNPYMKDVYKADGPIPEGLELDELDKYKCQAPSRDVPGETCDQPIGFTGSIDSRTDEDRFDWRPVCTDGTILICEDCCYDAENEGKWW